MDHGYGPYHLRGFYFILLFGHDAGADDCSIPLSMVSRSMSIVWVILTSGFCHRVDGVSHCVVLHATVVYPDELPAYRLRW